MAEYIDIDEKITVTDTRGRERETTVRHILDLNGGVYTAADVRPVVKGFNKLKDYPSLFECSVCGWECGDTVPGDTETYNFCPNCGARMEES